MIRRRRCSGAKKELKIEEFDEEEEVSRDLACFSTKKRSILYKLNLSATQRFV